MVTLRLEFIAILQTAHSGYETVVLKRGTMLWYLLICPVSITISSKSDYSQRVLFVKKLNKFLHAEKLLTAIDENDESLFYEHLQFILILGRKADTSQDPESLINNIAKLEEMVKILVNHSYLRSKKFAHGSGCHLTSASIRTLASSRLLRGL
ncbi:hypothetical protein AERO9A_180038 [Aeromonas salmonicida]|nr:hypothetical protein AERO9A_180038 [Aeromonas salmonicida]